MAREIIFFGGNVIEFYKSQDSKVQLKIEYVLDLVRFERQVPTKFFKKLASTNGIYLYLIWDLRDAILESLCFAATAIDACCDCIPGNYYLNASFENATSIFTDINMTRFWLTIDEGVQFVLDSLSRMHGGEIFVPKIPSFKVVDVATVISPNSPIKIIGIRPGEKLHEVMITEDDSEYTLEFKDYYAILAPFLMNSSEYSSVGTKVPKGFSFNSENNKLWYNFDTFKMTLQNAGLLN